MNLTRQYILQAISLASNNLRLSSDRIETVAYLKDHLHNCVDLEKEIAVLKTKTELSKFAIKLGEVFQYMNSSNIDFLKLTEKYKEHSHNLIIELSNVLDQVNVEMLKIVLTPIENIEELAVDLGHKEATKNLPTNLYKENFQSDEEESKEIKERDTLKEELIFEDVAAQNQFDFADFEETILKPVAKLEKMLNGLGSGEISDEEISKYITIMKKNEKLSEQVGFNILAEMHSIFYRALDKISSKKINADKKIIESMRACLIVIVAIVRSKDVEITSYMNKAEKLGKHLESY